jgi:RNA polymerase sigma-70 factor, ECF subfamily
MIFGKNLHKITDEETMAMVIDGNRNAFSEIYDRYFERLFRYFFRMLGGDREKATDFAQDLFLKIIEKPEQYNPEKKFAIWIFVIASNMCKNEYRSLDVRQRHLQMSPPETKEHINYEQDMDNRRFREDLVTEVHRLDEKHRNVFLLRYEQELSIKEIAEIVDCSEGTVKSRLFYSLKKLSDKLSVYNPKLS